MKPRTLVAVLGLAVLSTYGACRTFAHHDDEVEVSGSLLHDRFWLESMPEKRTDYVHGFFIVGGQDMGLFSRSSNFDLHLEIFEVDESAKELKLRFPQTNKRATVGFTVKTCSEKKGFDLCLDLSENPWGGPKRYYGMKDHESETRAVGALRDAVVRAAPKP